jgi:Domain of unknown function (DUF4384)
MRADQSSRDSTGFNRGPAGRALLPKVVLAARGCLVLAILAGCAQLAPIAVKLGADLISAAANNYSQQYSRQLETLLLAVFTEQAAKRFPGQAASGPGQAAAYPPVAGQEPYPPMSGLNARPAPADPYPSTGGGQSPSGSTYPSPSLASSPAVVLDVAILAQRASARAARRTEPVPLRDGDVLRDGAGDPRKGDVVKFSFRTNCDCYVYVIGVDATGYVVRVFPEKSGKAVVRANRQYVVPEGSSWYGLDEYKGTEQVFFIASRRPRPDIEASLGQLAKTGRSSLARGYRPVREAAVPDAASRGLVKVQMGTKSTVQSESGEPHAFTPQAFVAQQGADDVVVTRWFRHE